MIHSLLDKTFHQFNGLVQDYIICTFAIVIWQSSTKLSLYIANHQNNTNMYVSWLHLHCSLIIPSRVLHNLTYLVYNSGLDKDKQITDKQLYLAICSPTKLCLFFSSLANGGDLYDHNSHLWLLFNSYDMGICYLSLHTRRWEHKIFQKIYT